MAISKIEVERFSVISSRPFENVVATLKAAVGHPDMVQFATATMAPGPSQNLRVRSGRDWAGLAS